MTRAKSLWPVLAPAILLAATPAPVAGQSSSAYERPFVVVATAEQEMIYLTDPLTVRVETRNNPSDSQVFRIVSLTVRFPAALQLTGRCPEARPATQSSKADPGQPCDVPIRSADGAAPGVAGAATLPGSSFWLDPIGALTFRSLEYRVLVHVTYHALDQATKAGVTREFDVPLSVKPKAPLTAVIAGGIGGVLLVLAFTLFGEVGSGRRRRTSAHTHRAHPLELLSVFLYGALATTLAILLLAVTNITGFPISVSIADATGGVVLGLFFKPVGTFIQSRIAPKADVPAQPQRAQVLDE